jgi:hypothetical protein
MSEPGMSDERARGLCGIRKKILLGLFSDLESS